MRLGVGGDGVLRSASHVPILRRRRRTLGEGCEGGRVGRKQLGTLRLGMLRLGMLRLGSEEFHC
jgi:hypothetical protein